MLDLKILRDRASEVEAIYRDRLFDDAAVAVMGQVKALDERRRALAAQAAPLAGASHRDCGHGHVRHTWFVRTHCAPRGHGFVGEQPSAHSLKLPQS